MKSGAELVGSYYYAPIEIKNSTKCDKPEYKKTTHAVCDY